MEDGETLKISASDDASHGLGDDWNLFLKPAALLQG